MKKMIMPLLSFMLLSSPYAHADFSDGLIVGGIAGLTAGVITTAIAHQNTQPDVIIAPCPLHQCTGCTPHGPCQKHRPRVRQNFKRTHTKIKRRPNGKCGRQRCAALVRQERALTCSIRELEALKASIAEESKRVELIIKDMQLKLRETKLDLQQRSLQIA